MLVVNFLLFNKSFKRGNNKNYKIQNLFSNQGENLGTELQFSHILSIYNTQNNSYNDIVCNQFMTFLPYIVQFHSHNIILIEIHPEGTFWYTHGDNQRDVMRYLRCLMEWNIIILFVMKFLEFSISMCNLYQMDGFVQMFVIKLISVILEYNLRRKRFTFIQINRTDNSLLHGQFRKHFYLPLLMI